MLIPRIPRGRRQLFSLAWRVRIECGVRADGRKNKDSRARGVDQKDGEAKNRGRPKKHRGAKKAGRGQKTGGGGWGSGQIDPK